MVSLHLQGAACWPAGRGHQAQDQEEAQADHRAAEGELLALVLPE